MPFNLEYHLAETVDKDHTHSSVISRGTRRTRIRRPLTVCLLVGILVGVVVIVVISLCMHQYVLATDYLGSDETNSAWNSFANASFSDFELPEDFREVNQFDLRFIDTLTPSEKDSVGQLRLAVEDKLTHSYMKTAYFLARWLKVRSWDVEDAKDMILDHLEWRIEYEIDSVLVDNFTFFENEFPFYEDGVAYEGGPVGCINVGDWDLRNVAVGGYHREFIRYASRFFERAIDLSFKMQSKGVISPRGTLIVNTNNYAYAKHGCFSCISVLGSFLFAMDENYPGWIHPIIVINTSEFAETVVNMMLSYLTGGDRGAIEVFGSNKDEWQKKILTLVAADQIRPEFGGTKVDVED